MRNKLISIPANSGLPRSINALDNKGDELYKVWEDGKITVNSKDLFVEETKTAIIIAENFDLFYNNIQLNNPDRKSILDELSDTDKNLILSALTLSYTRYNTNYNGNEFMDFTFNNVDTQNAYAEQFHTLEARLRKQLLPNK